MNQLNRKNRIVLTKLLTVAVAVVALLLASTAHAAAPGITGTAFSLVASQDYISQPDGAMIYSWGYGCSGTVAPASF